MTTPPSHLTEAPQVSSNMWFRIANTHPSAMRILLREPRSPIAISELRKAYETLQHGHASNLEHTEDNGDKVYLLITYQLSENDYTVSTLTAESLHKLKANIMFQSAYNASSLGNGRWLGAEHVIFNEELVTSIMEKGAILMIIPNGASINYPDLVGLSRTREGVTIFHAFNDNHERLIIPATTLKFNANLEQGIQYPELIRKIIAKAEAARAKGKKPAIAVDLDGTVFDARSFAISIFKEWLESYRGSYSSTIRDHAAAHRKRIFGWDSEDILIKLLHDLDIPQEAKDEAMVSARTYFKSEFYSPLRRLEMQTIEGTARLVRQLQRSGIHVVYVTLRSTEDDALPGGGSSSETALRRAGLWNEGTTLIRHEGPAIDWSFVKNQNGLKEPPKYKMLSRFRRSKNGEIWFVATLDNAPAHILDYHGFFKSGVVNIHIQGDLPPGSPDLPIGAFSLEPHRLAHEMRAWDAMQTGSLSTQILAREAFVPLMNQFWTARGRGITPVVILDIDDTIIDSRRRAHKIFLAFLDEVWIPKHPEDAWARAFVEATGPNAMYYEINDNIRAMGITGLGGDFERELTKYFYRRFLSKDYLTADQAVAGAADFTRTLHLMGVKIVYVTGRPKGLMEQGTIEWLAAAGFPINHANVSLRMLDDTTMDASLFKAKVYAEYAGSERVIGVFDNEPDDLVLAGMFLKDAPLYQVGTYHKSSSGPAPQGTILIADFLGNTISPELAHPETAAAQAITQGQRLALEIIKLSREVYHFKIFPPHERDSTNYPGNAMKETAGRVKSILKYITAIPPAHPERMAFIEALNSAINKNHARLVLLERFIEYVNTSEGTSMILLPSQDGALNILDASDNLPTKAYAGTPATFDMHPIPPLDENLLEVMMHNLLSLSAGPRLSDADTTKMSDALSFGSYPRLEVAFGYLISRLSRQRGIKRENILALEINPGAAIAPMLTIHRLGAKVGWRSTSEIQAKRTMIEIGRIDSATRPALALFAADEPIEADMVIINMPSSQDDINQAIRDLKQGGYLVMETDANLLTPIGFELEYEYKLPAGEYIMPSHYIPISNQPRYFLIFKKK